jgi:hypothetical protein
MIHENEILTVILGAGILHFIILKHAAMKENPSVGLLVPAFCILFSAWVLSILEAFFWAACLNFIEHFLYLLCALCLCAWVRQLPFLPESVDK